MADILPGSMTLGANAAATAVSITLTAAPHALAQQTTWICLDPFTVQAEIREVTSVVNTTVNLASALVYAHSTNDPLVWMASPVWDVKLFGATGDGSTDDSAAIQAAIDDTDGGMVYIPRGKYVIGTTLDIQPAADQRIILQGVTPGARWYDASPTDYGTTLIADTDIGGPVIKIDGTVTGTTVPKRYAGAMLRDLKIDGNEGNQSVSTSDCHGIEIIAGKDIRLDNITVQYAKYRGIYVDSGVDVDTSDTISSNVIVFGYVEAHNCEEAGFYFGSGAGDIYAVHLEAAGNCAASSPADVAAIYASQGLTCSQARTYLNEEGGVFLSAENRIGILHSNHNNTYGLRFAGRDNIVDQLFTQQNGQDLAEAAVLRSGVYWVGDHNHIGRFTDIYDSTDGYEISEYGLHFVAGATNNFVGDISVEHVETQEVYVGTEEDENHIAQRSIEKLLYSETFTANAGTDRLTISTGPVPTLASVVRVSTTDTLPGGLLVSTNYYVIPYSSTQFYLATSAANARAHTEINITTAGVGTHTVSQLQFAPVAWRGVIKEMSLSGALTILAPLANSYHAGQRIAFDFTSEAINCALTWNAIYHLKAPMGTVHSNGFPLAISSISGSGAVVTVATTNTHYLRTGDSFTISDTTSYDGTYSVAAVTSATGFTFADAGVGAETTGVVTPKFTQLYIEFEYNGRAWLEIQRRYEFSTESAITQTIADPGHASAIVVTNSGHVPIITTGAETRTLAAPSFVGQELLIYMMTDGGNCTITCATTFNETGNNTIILANTGETVRLTAIKEGANRRWRAVIADPTSILSTV